MFAESDTLPVKLSSWKQVMTTHLDLIVHLRQSYLSFLVYFSFCWFCREVELGDNGYFCCQVVQFCDFVCFKFLCRKLPIREIHLDRLLAELEISQKEASSLDLLNILLLSIPTVTYNKIPLSSGVGRYMYPTWSPRTTLLVQAYYLGQAKFPTVFRCSRSKDNVSTQRFSSGSMTQQEEVVVCWVVLLEEEGPYSCYWMLSTWRYVVGTSLIPRSHPVHVSLPV